MRRHSHQRFRVLDIVAIARQLGTEVWVIASLGSVVGQHLVDCVDGGLHVLNVLLCLGLGRLSFVHCSKALQEEAAEEKEKRPHRERGSVQLEKSSEGRQSTIGRQSSS